MEQKILESQLNETKEESATAKMQALKARDDVLSNFVDLMEMELQCTICNELFIKVSPITRFIKIVVLLLPDRNWEVIFY